MSHPPAQPDRRREPSTTPAPPGEPPPQESVENQFSSTGLAPPFPAAVAKPGSGVSCCDPQVGDRIGDFEIIQLLGEGSFAKVFLARQASLGRLVALKVSAHHGSEARTLAHLEHDHIVRIFAESVDCERGVRLLCMQYVPGPTLDGVLRKLGEREARLGGGRRFLDALDGLCSHPAAFDPAALRDRELLAGCDFVECVCWLGGRLAEALAHAHGLGILHRDIKPANILLTPYGRPLLADFNLALTREPGEGSFGGTLAYMAPEHIEAFHRGAAPAAAQVDERSDVYSLGVVLFQWVSGRLPFQTAVPRGMDYREALPKMAAERRAGIPRISLPDEGSEALGQVIGRCLEPVPERRYQSAAELARALGGCGELRRAAKALPAGGWLVRSAGRRPFLWLAILALTPHFLGSLVNISYNGLRIDLTPKQHEAFGWLTLGYNLLVYPVCVGLLLRLIWQVARGFGGAAGPAAPDAAQLTRLRQYVLRLPFYAAVLSAAGWLPGGLLFPLGIDYLAGPGGTAVYGHFLISFTIAGLIALTYAVFGVQFMVLRILYPRLWGDGREFREKAALELRPVAWRLWLLQLLAGLIPLAAATLLISTWADDLPAATSRDFRLLVMGLIALGTAGFVLAVSVSGFLSRTLTVLTTPSRASV